jgi:hypothetical protein
MAQIGRLCVLANRVEVHVKGKKKNSYKRREGSTTQEFNFEVNENIQRG